MTLRSLGIIRPKDMPPIDVVLVECPQPRSPYGVKGVGEIGLVPTAGAVANALARFDGVRRYALPMRDSAAARALRGIGDSEAGARDSGLGTRPHEGH
jgi:xanthine dehydrogenase molybdenum-binding subunit